MSVVFYLKESPIKNADSLRALADDYLEAEDLEPLIPVDNSPSQVFLAVPGSTRGVVFELEDDSIQIRLSLFASLVEWKLGFGLMKALLSKGGQLESEHGKAFAAEQLTEERAEQFWREEGQVGLATLRDQGDAMGEMNLPCGYFSIPLSSQDFPKADGVEAIRAFEATLAERFERYARAFPASKLKLPNEGGSEQILSNWAFIPTLMERVDLVSFSPSNALGEAVVKFDDVLKILGDRAERLGDDAFFLPEIDPDEEPELITALKEKSFELEAGKTQPTAVPDLEGGLPDTTLTLREQTEVATYVARTIVQSLMSEKKGAAQGALIKIIADEKLKDPVWTMGVCTTIMKMFDKVGKNEIKPEGMGAFLLSEGHERQTAQAIIDVVHEEARHGRKSGGCVSVVLLCLFVAGLLTAVLW